MQTVNLQYNVPAGYSLEEFVAKVNSYVAKKSNMEIKLTVENFESVTNTDKPVLIDFWATWCGPCRMQAPILEEFDKQMEGRVRVCKLDVDEVPAIAQRFGVMSIPTLIAFKDGKQLSKEVGVTSCEELMTMFG